VRITIFAPAANERERTSVARAGTRFQCASRDQKSGKWKVGHVPATRRNVGKIINNFGT
jgi:hypothetical protein